MCLPTLACDLDTARTHRLKVRDTSNEGETQPDVAKWNRGGYMRNVIETVETVETVGTTEQKT